MKLAPYHVHLVLFKALELALTGKYDSWTASKVLREDSEAQEALSFLLEHPRRYDLLSLKWAFNQLTHNIDVSYTCMFISIPCSTIDNHSPTFRLSFPSHQTWFLVVCLAVFSTIEWVAFLVLSMSSFHIYLDHCNILTIFVFKDIGLPAYESISVGPRVVAGLFQGLAARASGFAIVPVANLAPALQ